MNIPCWFRARDEEGKLHYGYYHCSYGISFLTTSNEPKETTYRIDEKTLEIDTGLKAMGNFFVERLFTGDTISVEELDGKETMGTIVFDRGAFWFRPDGSGENNDVLLYEVLKNNNCRKKGRY